MLGEMSLARGMATVLATVVALTALPAWGAPTASEKETARALVLNGRKKLKDGDSQGALDDFAAAHAIMNVPTTGREVGLAQMELGRLLEARDIFLSVVRMPLERGEPPAFRAARKEAKQLADELAPRIPSVRISLKGDAAEGASVRIDDEPVPEESIGVAFKVNPGEHEIVAGNGDIEQRVTIDVVESETEDVTLELSRPPVAEEEPSDPTLLIAMGASFGLAAVGVIVGSATGAVSLGAVHSASRQCVMGRCPPSTHDELDRAETMGTVSTAAFVVGGVAAAVGATLLTIHLVDSDDDAAPELAFDVSAAHASLRGRW
jgi:hypothetical protein